MDSFIQNREVLVFPILFAQLFEVVVIKIA